MPYGMQQLWATQRTPRATTDFRLIKDSGVELLGEGKVVKNWAVEGVVDGIMQDDGNFVLYGKEGPLWSSNSWQGAPYNSRIFSPGEHKILLKHAPLFRPPNPGSDKRVHRVPSIGMESTRFKQARPQENLMTVFPEQTGKLDYGLSENEKLTRSEGHVRNSQQDGASETLLLDGDSGDSNHYFGRVSFEEVLKEVSGDYGVAFSVLDLSIFHHLYGTKVEMSYFHTDGNISGCGMYIQTPSQTFTPKGREDTAILEYGGTERREKKDTAVLKYGGYCKNRVVMFEAENLTPVGLSLLFWSLPPSEETRTGMKNVMKKSGIRNCFIEKVTKSAGSQDNAPSTLFIPQSWAYFLGVSEDFMENHGECADFGVSLSSPISLDRREPGIMECASRGSGKCGEYLFLNDNYRLTFIENVAWRVNVTGVNATGGAFGFTVAGGVAGAVDPNYVQGVEQTASGRKVIFRSLNHFAGLPMNAPYDYLWPRMLWLKDVLGSKYIFPEGENLRFLEVTIGILDSKGRPRSTVFSDNDGKIHRETLRIRECKQWKNGHHECIFIPESKEGTYQRVSGYIDENGFFVPNLIEHGPLPADCFEPTHHIA